MTTNVPLGSVWVYGDDLTEWFICVDTHPSWPGEKTLVCIKSNIPRGRVGYGYSPSYKDAEVSPIHWPDDVCAIVAQWQLTGKLGVPYRAR